MTWRSFMDYVIMRELGQDDAIVRNYDLDHLNGAKPGITLDRAFARMGFDQKNTARAFVLPIVAQHMRNVGYQPRDLLPGMLDKDHLATLMRQWYTWDRIRRGEVQQWPLKKIADNPLF